MAWREIIYQYDGNFEGLLCCVFESYTKKERRGTEHPAHRRCNKGK